MALQESIDNFKTLSSQNGELIGQNNILIRKVNELSELAKGKQEIVDAINMMGGNASIEDSLYTLGEKIEQLVVVSPDTTFTDDVPTPINLSTIAVQPDIYALYVKHLYSEEVTYLNNIFKGSAVEIIHLPNMTSASYSIGYLFSNCPNLKSVYLESFNYSDSYHISVFENDYNLTDVHMPKCTSSSKSYEYNACRSLEIVEIPMLNSSFGYYSFNGCRNVIDITIGKNITSSFDMTNSRYNPTTAYSKATNSLCHDTDLERYGQTFATNWDKWKWCIINHFAANLLDRSGMEEAFTITFGSTVLAQFDEEMIAAFTDKNWTLA